MQAQAAPAAGTGAQAQAAPAGTGVQAQPAAAGTGVQPQAAAPAGTGVQAQPVSGTGPQAQVAAAPAAPAGEALTGTEIAAKLGEEFRIKELIETIFKYAQDEYRAWDQLTKDSNLVYLLSFMIGCPMATVAFPRASVLLWAISYNK